MEDQENHQIGVEEEVQEHPQEEGAATEMDDDVHSDVSNDSEEEEGQGAAASPAVYVFHGDHLARGGLYFGAAWIVSLSVYEKRDVLAILAKFEVVDMPEKTSDFEAVAKGIHGMHICYVIFALSRWFTIVKMWVARNLILGIAASDYAEIRTIEKALIDRKTNEGEEYVREGTNERLSKKGILELCKSLYIALRKEASIMQWQTS